MVNQPKKMQHPRNYAATQKRDYYQCKVLHFLVELFDAMGITLHQFSLLTSNPNSTAGTLRLQFSQDDMRLSKAKWIVSVLGLYLKVYFIMDEEPRDPNYIVRIPKEVVKNASAKNLDFLEMFLRKEGISRRQLARDLQMSSGAVETWFQADDIAISYLMAIKDKYKVKLVFEITKP